MKEHKTQLIHEEKTYIIRKGLYAVQNEVGLGKFVNMGFDRVVIERVIRPETSCDVEEDWSAWEDTRCSCSNQIRPIFQKFVTDHQTGYGTEITEKILHALFHNENIEFFTNPVTESYFHGTPLGTSALDCILLNKNIVFCYTCLFDDNKFNRSRVKSYMRSLDAPFGLAVNFGKKSVEIKAYST
ncbi:MAG: hypothetical protein LAT83_09220 [Kiritimatiellae bacterium]|nr:hypothetical protein [Kiritimatiellia bacterium]